MHENSVLDDGRTPVPKADSTYYTLGFDVDKVREARKTCRGSVKSRNLERERLNSSAFETQILWNEIQMLLQFIFENYEQRWPMHI